MKYPVIIFDWDGTLMDSLDKIVYAMQQAALVNELSEPSELAIRNIIGLSLDKAVNILFPSYPITTQLAVKQAYREQYSLSTVHPSPLYLGIEEWLVSLKEQGYTLAIATGKGRNGLNHVLSTSGLSDLFTVTYSADEANSKPDPLMLNKILADLNVQSHQALMIGDSSYDLEMANNANISCVGVSYGVHSVEQLQQYNPIAILDDLPNQLGQYI
jgi:phosphoglycolate phosphatase